MTTRRLSVKTAVVLFAMAGVMALGSAPALATREYSRVAAFGEPCSGESCGNGQLKEPTGVAVNGASEVSVSQPDAGDVYVIDTGNERVQQFSATGTYVSQWNGSATLAKAFSFSSESDSQGIAVDSSINPLDPAAGDVYVADVGHKVVDRFSASGVFTGLELAGTCAAPGTCPGKVIPFVGELLGVAADPSGNVWVYESEGNVDEFDDAGAFVESFNTGRGTKPGLGVDASDNVYPVFGDLKAGKYEAGNAFTEFGLEAEQLTALAVNPATGEVLLDQGSSIERFEEVTKEEPKPLETFATELSESHGIAVNGGSEGKALYVSRRAADDIEIFGYLLFPGATTEAASGISETGLTLHGTVNPEGEPVTSCSFEYGTTTAYGQNVPCEQSPSAIGEGGEPVAVSANLSGLTPATARHYRLVATNTNGTKDAHDFAINRPTIEGVAASNIGSTEATVTAQITAQGLSTVYQVEYGTSEAYGSSTAQVNVGAPAGTVNVSTQLSGLQSGTVYHYRLLATNALGTSLGSEVTFTTIATAGLASVGLPDGRAYELVSSPTSNANVYPPVGELSRADATYNLVRAANTGNGVVYQADPPTEGGAGNTGAAQGNAYIAKRDPGGWEQVVLQLSNGLAYEGVSSDLSVGVLNPDLSGARERTKVPSPTPEEPANCRADALYSYTSGDGGYHALVSSTPTLAPTFCQGEFGGGNGGTATVPQYSHVLFQSQNILTPDAVEPTVEHTDNLYDSVGGRLHLVSVLPDGKPATDARFAGNEPIGQEDVETLGDTFAGGSVNGSPDDISTDGSRVFWTRVERIGESERYLPLALYTRENDTQPQSSVINGECTVPSDACTLQIDARQEGAEGESGGGLFWTASSDGSKVFFTDDRRLTVGSTAALGEPDLYEYEVNGETGRPGTLIDLTVDENGGEHANVQGVMGASADSSYVYFAATGALTSGRNAEGKEPLAGQTNFYVRHDGVTTFIATADPDREGSEGFTGEQFADLALDVGHRTAEVTPDGRNLVFRSRTPLTGYDSSSLAEVFVYDFVTGHISCTSCSPTGARPTEGVSPYKYGAALTISYDSDFMFRWLSDDGARVFFVTGQPLVAQDVNGLQDVYEWERPSSGSDVDNSCTQSSPGFSEVNEGCVYLLSGGTSSDDSYFLDASTSGDDVFIRSRAKLAPQSVNENMALYDARVGGGFPETRLACTGTGCQGVPPAAPIFATPSSATFNGVGNFSTPASNAKKATKKKIVKCAKGKKRSHGKCVKRKKARKGSRKPSKSVRGKS
jgi:hypothetical protein